MTHKLIATTSDLQNQPGFQEAWGVCRHGVISFLNERLITRAKSPGDAGATRELALLIDDLRSIGFTAPSPTETKPLMPQLHSMSDDKV